MDHDLNKFSSSEQQPDIGQTYTSGQFAKKAHVSIRTIRYYDQQDILKPSWISESGTRHYTDADFAHLQQILLLKYLGFSLNEIREMTIGDSDYHILLNSLQLQQKLIKDRIAQLQLVDQAITNTTNAISKNQSIDWSNMLELIHLTNMETSLQNQYVNAGNISARINLHTLYSINKEGWFPWVFHLLQKQLTNISSDDSSSHSLSLNPHTILELGCGDGSLWVQNYDSIPENTLITLSDISRGMLLDAKRNLEARKNISQKSAYEKAINVKAPLKLRFKVFDCAKIPYENQSFDVVIANHVLFYCADLESVLSEVHRILKPNGIFLCSTYGAKHMKEISQLVKQFDERIMLSRNKLYERFGLENAASILKQHFVSIETHLYDDALVIDKPEPLIDYILSCHGNQNQYLLNRYTDFKLFLSEQFKRNHGMIHITKEAGVFVCKNI